MILLSTQEHQGGPMETFTKLFGSLLAFVYHCFDRIVIQGYIPLLTRPEHIVHFFRDVHGITPSPNRL
jgi:hypothetical protein